MRPLVSILFVPFLILGEAGKREKLALYRGVVEEGKRLDNFCRHSRLTLRYADRWELDQALRSSMATVQLLGLEVTTKALAKYANYFQFTPTEYGHLVDNLVGNFCSRNITVMNPKKIKEKMTNDGQQNDFLLPLANEVSSSLEKDYRKREFGLTLDLFKIFCSWGGDIREAVLLPVLLRNPVWMGFVGQHMAGEKLAWNKKITHFLSSIIKRVQGFYVIISFAANGLQIILNNPSPTPSDQMGSRTISIASTASI